MKAEIRNEIKSYLEAMKHISKVDLSTGRRYINASLFAEGFSNFMEYKIETARIARLAYTILKFCYRNKEISVNIN